MKISTPKIIRDIISPWRAYVAEFLGTLVFVFVASGAVLTNYFYGDVGILGIALATGFSLAAMMYATFHISGGHLNPAVTLSLWLTQKIGGAVAIFYIVSQILASFAAAELLFLIYGQKGLEFMLGAPRAVTSNQVALILEVVMSAILVFVIFATLVDKKGQSTLGPLIVGLVVVFATIMAGSLSGAVLNPARVLGPLVISKSYDLLPIFIAGPVTGGLFGLVYDWLFLRRGRK